MKLECDGASLENPTKADILRAIPAQWPGPDWDGVWLGRSPEDSVELDAGEDGLFKIAYISGRRIHDAERPVTAAGARQVFIRYFEDRPDWKEGLVWDAWDPAETAVGSGRAFQTQAIALGLVTVLLAAVTAIFLMR
jgi:hypothetical protein